MAEESAFLSLLSTVSITWPKKGDRLLRDANHWEKGVGFSSHKITRDVHIWGGYVRAGVVLIEEVERSPLDKLDLVYPILFCYRHGLELAMKWIVSQYGRYADLPNDEDTRHHNLWQLWKVRKKVILLVGSDGDSEGLRAVEQIVKEFHDFDQTSLAFRYSQNKNGALIALPDCKIDLQNVRKVMEAVEDFFRGADGQLDHNVSSTGR